MHRLHGCHRTRALHRADDDVGQRVPSAEGVRAARRQSGTYRGRRRLPKLPSRRYAAVVTTAFWAPASWPWAPGRGPRRTGGERRRPTKPTLAVEDRLAALDKANRSQDRPGPAASVDQGAPDVWLLPVQVQFQITTVYEMRWGEFHCGRGHGRPVRHAVSTPRTPAR